MTDHIDRAALLARIEGPERPEINDGAEEVDWILKCLQEAPTVKPEAAGAEPLPDTTARIEAARRGIAAIIARVEDPSGDELSEVLARATQELERLQERIREGA